MTPPGYLLTLRQGAALERSGEGLRILWGGWERRLETGSPELAATLARLADGITEVELVESAASCGPGVASLHYCLRHLRNWGLLCYRVPVGRSFVQVQPHRPDFRFCESLPNLHDSYLLSRFALLRRIQAGLILESPLAPAAFLFEDPHDAGLVLRYSVPRPIEPEAMPLLRLLVETRFLEHEESLDPASRATWEFHDALFHRHTAVQDPWRPIGRTGRFQNAIPRPPEFKIAPWEEVVKLPEPAVARLRGNDLPLARVSDERRSIRTAGTVPIRLSELAEFLWRVARLPRPLPAAGGLHELEFYALIDRCDGVETGLYYYSGGPHQLHRLPSSPAAGTLADSAQLYMGTGEVRPQVVILVSARFARMAWTYEGIAYRNVLLDTGIALHAMYLAATAMGLAPCAIGWNDAELFARAAGTDPLVESSVALFALSSRGVSPAEA